MLIDRERELSELYGLLQSTRLSLVIGPGRQLPQIISHQRPHLLETLIPDLVLFMPSFIGLKDTIKLNHRLHALFK